MDADQHDHFARATDHYVSRMPSPPRIQVPPPHSGWESTSADSNRLEDLGEAQHEESLRQTHPVVDWNYDSRKQAQRVFCSVWLGPSTVAKDVDWLRCQRITMVLLVRHAFGSLAKMTPAAIRIPQQVGIQTHCFDTVDAQSLSAILASAVKSIDSHLQRRNSQTNEPGNVLVCCETGNGRSAAVVIAYIMAIQKVGMVRAVQHLQTHRFCINIDDPLKNILQAFGDVLTARRDVNGSSLPNLGASKPDTHLQVSSNGTQEIQRRSSKRALGSWGETEEDMDMDNDEERFDHRNFAPFVAD